MKVNCWDRCFLCLTNLGSTSSSSSCGGKRSRGRQKQKEINGKLNLSVLIKYLLGSWDENGNDSLLQKIRRLQKQQQPPSSTSSEASIKFCDKCQDSARRLSHLQMELEVIQMKIVDILRSLRKTVIGSSKGNDGTSGLSLEEFTGERQEILDTLHAFREAVDGSSKESIHVPLVYIEKFTGCKNLNLNRATATGEEDNKLNLIKTEPETDPLVEILSDFGNDDDYSSTITPMEFNDGVEMEHDDQQEERMDTNNELWTPPGHRKKEKCQRKRGRPRKTPPAPKLKEELAEFLALGSEQVSNLNATVKQEDFTNGTRKTRSAALKRIADVKIKKLSRQKKIAKEARKCNEAPDSSSSSRYPYHPNKILLNPVLKTGKRFKPPKKESKPKQPPRIKKNFECEICPYKTVKNFQFEHHLTLHESPEVVNHICPHCTNPVRQFSQKQSFDFHMNSHAGLNKMMCDLCSKFLDPFSILEHLQGHSNLEKIFKCPCCAYHCGTREMYLKHTRYHRGADALVCDVCSRKFRHRTKMLQHMHEEHNLLEKIKCDVADCDREFLETVAFEAHKRHHTQAFVCFECNIPFPNAQRLTRHQARNHSGERPHQCSECPERFLDKATLERHLIQAHGAAKFKCPHCPKEYSSKAELSSHINIHEGITFPCDECGKIFQYRHKLKRHQLVHRTTKDFICEECGQAFRYGQLLRAHIKIHIGDKKHKCSFCPKTFVDRKNVNVHERIHTGEKPYVCEACGKDFNQLGPLNQHMKTQHKELIANKNQREVSATEAT